MILEPFSALKVEYEELSAEKKVSSPIDRYLRRKESPHFPMISTISPDAGFVSGLIMTRSRSRMLGVMKSPPYINAKQLSGTSGMEMWQSISLFERLSMLAGGDFR